MRAQLITHAALVLLTLENLGGEATIAEIIAKIRSITSRPTIHEGNVRSQLDLFYKCKLADRHSIDRYDGHPDKPGGALGEQRRTYRLTKVGSTLARQYREEIGLLVGGGPRKRRT